MTYRRAKSLIYNGFFLAVLVDQKHQIRYNSSIVNNKEPEMSKNILWQNLSAKQIRDMIRNWPVSEPKASAKAPQTPVVRVVKAAAPAAPKAKVQAKSADRARKHFGADGEVKFVAHRNIWIGFWGGKAVVKRSTQEACREALKVQFGAVKQG
jgi:hypothetical protein